MLAGLLNSVLVMALHHHQRVGGDNCLTCLTDIPGILPGISNAKKTGSRCRIASRHFVPLDRTAPIGKLLLFFGQYWAG